MTQIDRLRHPCSCSWLTLASAVRRLPACARLVLIFSPQRGGADTPQGRHSANDYVHARERAHRPHHVWQERTPPSSYSVANPHFSLARCTSMNSSSTKSLSLLSSAAPKSCPVIRYLVWCVGFPLALSRDKGVLDAWSPAHDADHRRCPCWWAPGTSWPDAYFYLKCHHH